MIEGNRPTGGTSARHDASEVPTADVSRLRLRAVRERERFERDLDATRDLLERRTAALTRTQANLARAQRELEELRSDPLVRLAIRMRAAVARLARAPRRLRRMTGTGGGGGPDVDSARAETGPSGSPRSVQIAVGRGDPGGDLPNTFRSRLLDALAGRELDGRLPVRIAVVGGTPGLDLQDIFRASTVRLETIADDEHGDADLALVLDPGGEVASIARHVLRVGWVQQDLDRWLAAPWLADLDHVAATTEADRGRLETTIGSASLAATGPEIVAALTEYAARPRIAIQIGPASWEVARTWGDTPFARALERAFRRRGWATSVLVDSEADCPPARRADVALHVVGLRRPPLHPGQTHVLWIISHPDAVRAERCDRYDAVFVASDEFAEQLSLRISRPVVALHQATDPDLFFPEAGGPGHELLFVGNSRNRRRAALDALADAPWDLAVYGTKWRPELLDPRRLRGEWIPNEDLHRYYAAASIVLNDHWPDMRDEGFLSNRIYDALASGAFVLSDDVPGIDGEFEGGVATWTDATTLRAAIERYLPDPGARRALAERGRAAVLARHTFDHRVARILEVLESLGPTGEAASSGGSARQVAGVVPS